MDDLVTPVVVDTFTALLNNAGYDSKKIKFLHDGFTNGFDLGYIRPRDIKCKAPNLKIRVGDHIDL